MRICSKCGHSEDEVEFYSHTPGTCKPCVLERNAAWRQRNPSYMRDHAAARRASAPDAKRLEHLWSRYGITADDYYRMFEDQDGVCAICSRMWDPLHVDHCHVTGQVRGLLCGPCNTALGAFRDEVEILANAIEYLNRWGKFADRPDCEEQLIKLIEGAMSKKETP